MLYKPDKVADLNPGTDTQETPEVESEMTPDVALAAKIVAAERREDDYYVQVETNGAFDGTCEFALTSADEKQKLEHTANLEPADRVSACESFFPLKDLELGEYSVTVLVTAKSGDTKSVSKTVTIE